jgi:DNA (cytosine-5)-methyltransferase 1
VPVFGNVRTVATGEPVPERFRPGAVDLLCGGFPCQDVSRAGRRDGLAGRRSILFFEFARVADVVQPRWLLVENVPGLLTSNGGRDFGSVLATLADLGYGVAWRFLNSRFFGVPQQRRRVFIVGARADGDTRAAAERAAEVLAVGTRCPRHHHASGKAAANVALGDVASALGGRRGHSGDDVDRGGALVAHAVTDHGKARAPDTQEYFVDGARVRRLMPVECERLQGLPDGWTDVGGVADAPRYAALGDAVTATVGEWIGRRLA